MAKINGHTIGAIKRAIDKHVKANSFLGIVHYPNWYIGVTNDPPTRKTQHESEKNITAHHFKEWEANNVAEALAIEKYFHDLKMGDRDTPGNVKPDSVYVYVFKF